MTDSLWGDLPTGEDLRTPAAILREQAEHLSQATGGLLTGEVEVKGDAASIHMDLWIIAPALNDYRYKLTEVRHNVLTYPAAILSQDGHTWVSTANEGEFMTFIGEILSSAETSDVVRSLLAQIRAAT